MTTDPIPSASIEAINVGDEIVGPYGHYHIRVTSTDGDCIEGVYTKVREADRWPGYHIGMFCRYLKRDWHGKAVQYVGR